MTPKVVCVLGMHRSGTSVVSRMLSLLGAHLGPERSTMAPAADNPKGYWEHSGLVDINNAILSRFGGTWDNPPDFPEGWPTSPQVQEFRQRAQEIIKGDFSDTPLWSWKDPRCSVTLPFWQQVMPSMSYVVCVRNPVSVSRSLERRDGFSMHKSAALWLKYTASAVRYTSGKRRLLVFYEDVMQNWEVELDRLATFVGTRASISEASVREIREFLEPELYHHRNKVLTAVDEPQLSLPAKSLYLLLLQARHSTIPDRLRDEIEAAVDVYASKAARREFNDELASETQSTLRAELIESQRQSQSLAFERDSLQHQAEQERLSNEQALASQSNRLLTRVASARHAASVARNDLRIDRAQLVNRRSRARRIAGGLAASARGLGIYPWPRSSGTLKSLLRLFQHPRRLRDAYLIAVSGVLDESAYLKRYPDIATSPLRPLAHFVLWGAREGRQPHALFDTKWYKANVPGLATSDINPLVHYLERGARENREPHPFFSSGFYWWGLKGLPKVAANPLVDYCQLGFRESRDPHPLFDSAYYLECNPEAGLSGLHPFEHFMASGYREGRNPHPLFDIRFYLHQNSDVAASGMNPLVHYCSAGAFEGRSPHPLFDVPYYFSTQPDVKRSGHEPLSHFLVFGAAEGRAPNPLFDCRFYAGQVPEVAEGRINPLVHFVCDGWRAGLNPSANFDLRFYLSTNADVRQWGGNPLEHYLMTGRLEGRAIRPVGGHPAGVMGQHADVDSTKADQAAATLDNVADAASCFQQA